MQTLLLLLVILAGSHGPCSADGSGDSKFTDPRVIVGGLDKASAIIIYRMDRRTGVLTRESASLLGGIAPAYVAWQPRSSPVRALFVANRRSSPSEGALTAIRWTFNASLSPPATISSYPDAASAVAYPLDDPAHVGVHPSGRWAVTASTRTGSATVIPILRTPVTTSREDNSDAKKKTFKGKKRALSGADDDDNDRIVYDYTLGTPVVYPKADVGEFAHQAALDPLGRFLYVPCRNAGWVRTFAFNALTGALTPNVADNRAMLPTGAGPRHIALHPRLPVAYVANELDNTVARFDWDRRVSGALTADFSAEPERLVYTLPPGTPTPCTNINPACKQAASEIAISRDGRFLYVSNRGSAGGLSNIAVFKILKGDDDDDDGDDDRRDGMTGPAGALEVVGWADGGGDLAFPRHFSLSPDKENRFLLAGSENGDSVTVFARSRRTGLLTKVQTVSTAGEVGRPAFVSVVDPRQLQF
jgi:6-phosphogluconolactonase (cycloisomerase 2 family)